MKLLRIAVENKRWDLAAHTIVLATASVLKNGDKPHGDKNTLNIPTPAISSRSRGLNVTETGGGEFERKKRSPKR